MVRALSDRRVLISIGAIAALVAVALWPATVEVDVAPVSRGPLVVTVDEEGRTRVRERFVVSAPLAGRVLRLELEPGDRVKRGDVVARVQPEMSPLLDARTRADAEAALAGSRAALGRARAEEERARAALIQAQRELTRTRRLADGGVVSGQQVDTHETEVRLAESAVEAAVFAVRSASSEVDRAEARLAPPAARGAGSPGTVAITAPVDGVILRRLRESESVVPAGEPLMEMGNPARLEIVVDLLSTDATRIREGARAIIEEAGEVALDATVRRIEPAGFTKISALGVEEQRVNVILDLMNGTGEDGVLGDAYRVEVRIVTWESPSVLKVPTSALFRDGDRWAVYEIRDGRARRAIVAVGNQTGREAQVISGLSEGSRVIVHPGDRIADGVRVRERAAAAR